MDQGPFDRLRTGIGEAGTERLTRDSVRDATRQEIHALKRENGELKAFTQTLQEQRVQVSMDGKGRYLDNIFVERLWRSIKYEEVYLKAYQTVAEARTGINAYLEFYNRQRPHQALGYRTPAEVYQHGQEERGAAAEEAGLPSGLVKPSAGVGDSLNLALVLS